LEQLTVRPFSEAEASCPYSCLTRLLGIVVGVQDL
jgi:hypothetical protein